MNKRFSKRIRSKIKNCQNEMDRNCDDLDRLSELALSHGKYLYAKQRYLRFEKAIQKRISKLDLKLEFLENFWCKYFHCVKCKNDGSYEDEYCQCPFGTKRKVREVNESWQMENEVNIEFDIDKPSDFIKAKEIYNKNKKPLPSDCTITFAYSDYPYAKHRGKQ